MTDETIVLVDRDDGVASAIARTTDLSTTEVSTSGDALDLIDAGGVLCVVVHYDETVEGRAFADAAWNHGFAGPVLEYGTPDDDRRDVADAGASHVVDPDDVTSVRLFVNRIEAVEERPRPTESVLPSREKIHQLHAVATDLISAESIEEVACMTVDAAERILDLDMCVFDRVENGMIVPVAASSEMPEDGYDSDPLEASSVAATTYRENRSWLVEDAREVPEADPESDAFRAAISAPIGDFGIFQAVAEEPGVFDEADLELTEILLSHAYEAIQRVESQRELAERERFLSTLISNLPGMVYRCKNEREWPMEFVSDGCESLTGYRSEAFENDELSFGGDLIHPDDREPVWEDVQERVADDEPFELEYRICRADGEVRWVREQGRLVETEDGPRLEGLIIDVTERKEREAELRRQKDRLDEFARIVSHDLRNPLSVASGTLELLGERHDDEELDHVREALARMDEIIDSVLALVRGGERIDDPRPFDLESVVQTAWSNVDTADMSLEVEGTTTLHGDRALVCQLFENLVRNAREHAGSDVTVTVGTTDEGFYVADDGPGIDPDRRDSVFELGETDGDGTGIGLAIVRRIAEAHGWSVRVEAGDAGGTRFVFSTADGQAPGTAE